MLQNTRNRASHIFPRLHVFLLIMSSKRTPKRKADADTAASSTTGTKKARASAAKATPRTRTTASATQSASQQATSSVHVEWTNEQEIVTTTTITERTISLRNKTISTPIASRSTSRTTRKNIETTENENIDAMDVDDASWKPNGNDDGNQEAMELASMSDASEMATPAKRLYRRSSVGSTAGSVEVESANRPTSRRRISAGASAGAYVSSASAPGSSVQQDDTPAVPAASSSRRRSSTAAASSADSDAGSVASEIPSASGTKSKGRSAKVVTTLQAVPEVAASIPGPSRSSRGTGTGRGKGRKQQQQVGPDVSVVAVSNTTTSVPTLQTAAMPAPLQVPPATTINNNENSIHALATTATEADSGISQQLRAILAMVVRHYLSIALVLLLVVVAVLYRQNQQHPAVPISISPASPRFDFPTSQGNRSLGADHLLFEVTEQQENLRRVREELDRVRQEWNNASTAANEAAALSTQHEADAQLLFVKLREDNVLLDRELRSVEETMRSQLNEHQRALQAAADTSSARADQVEQEMEQLKPMISQLSSDANQLHTLVEAEVASVTALVGTLTNTGASPSTATDLLTLQKALNRAAEQVSRAVATVGEKEAEVSVQQSAAQQAALDAQARQNRYRLEYAAAQLKHQQHAAAVQGQATQEVHAAQQRAQEQEQRIRSTAKLHPQPAADLQIPAEPDTVTLSEAASADIIKKAAEDPLSQHLCSARETVESALNATLSETSVVLQREQQELIRDKISSAAAAEAAKSHNNHKAQRKADQASVQAADTQDQEDLYQRHDYAVGPRGGQVIHHRYMCPAFGGSQLTSPPYTAHGNGGAQPFGALTDALGSVAATFNRGRSERGRVTAGSRVSKYSSEARVLVSHLRPLPDHYYALSTKRLHSATASVHTLQGRLGSSERYGQEHAQEPYAGQVTILLTDSVYVEQIKLVTATAVDADSIQPCAPETFRIVGWTEDPRKVRDVRGKQVDLGTHAFSAPLPTTHYNSDVPTIGSGDVKTAVSDAYASGVTASADGSGESSSHVWEQQYEVPIEIDGVSVPALKAVTVHVLSNYGEREFTCLHRVQVIGVLENYLYEQIA